MCLAPRTAARALHVSLYFYEMLSDQLWTLMIKQSKEASPCYELIFTGHLPWKDSDIGHAIKEMRRFTSLSALDSNGTGSRVVPFAVGLNLDDPVLPFLGLPHSLSCMYTCCCGWPEVGLSEGMGQGTRTCQPRQRRQKTAVFAVN